MADEIEVTAEMAEAGSAEFLNHDFRDMTSITVANIYRAMEACRREEVRAADMQTISPEPISIRDIADPSFTNGLSPAEHIARLWAGDDGSGEFQLKPLLDEPKPASRKRQFKRG